MRATLRSNETDLKSSGEIIQILIANHQITIPKIAEQLSLTTRLVEKQLANLRKAGIVQQIGPAQGGGDWDVRHEEFFLSELRVILAVKEVTAEARREEREGRKVFFLASLA